MIIFGIALIAMFFLGYAYGRLIERKKQHGIDVKKPVEWIK
jgi:hypothetical protein